MASQIQLHHSPDYIEIVYEREVSGPELVEVAAKVMTLAQEQKVYRVFADCSQMHGGHDLFDLYRVGEWLAEKYPMLPMREAVVFAPASSQQEKVRFWTNVGNNRGHVIRDFTEREAAMAWLLESRATPAK